MGRRKSSAALLIVCERIFLLLGADYSSADQVRTKDDEYWKGYHPLLVRTKIVCTKQ